MYHLCDKFYYSLLSLNSDASQDDRYVGFLPIRLISSSRACPSLGAAVSHDLLLGRWRLSLDLFGRVFTEDVGLEPGSVVAELGGFPLKEVKFRRDMEKLRNCQQRDLTLHKVSSK